MTKKRRLTPTKLFIDGGDPKETAEATRLLHEAGYVGLDGQTTNPSLVAMNPDITARIADGELLTIDELLAKYKEMARRIEKAAPGDISIEVYADAGTRAVEMVKQARDFGTWIESAVIKLPITEEGLKAAEALKGELKLNMTLCFSQEQAAAVYAATRGSKYPVYISPFIGRLDDRGEDGMSLIANISIMFTASDGHVEILAASIRHIDHVLESLRLGVGAMTLPFEKAFLPWAETGFSLAETDYQYMPAGELIAYEVLNLNQDWREFNLSHELTDTGLKKFADDWNELLKVA